MKKGFLKSEMNKPIAQYLSLFFPEKDVFQTALLHNPFGVTENLEEIKKHFSYPVYKNLCFLNSLFTYDERFYESVLAYKPLVVLFLIDQKFIFNALKKKPFFHSFLSKQKISFALQLLERIDISEIRDELEDTFFSYLHPQIYKHYFYILKFIRRTCKNVEQNIRVFLAHQLNNEHIIGDIRSRIKSIYSIHKKIMKKNILYSQIFDTIGLRIIVKSKSDCYKVLELILKKCQILNSKIKDYIAVPKSNGYQSIHITVLYEGHAVEIQIRSEAMHRYAQYGFGSHYRYKYAESA